MDKNKISFVNDKEEEELIDKFSMLPNDVIHKILSLADVDMKIAVQIGIFSKGLKNIWKSLPGMLLDWSSFLEDKNKHKVGDVIGYRTLEWVHSRFTRFVNNVFDIRDDSDVRKINLRCVVYNDAMETSVEKWVSAAVRHNVQRLTLDLSHCHESRHRMCWMGSDILKSESLKNLKIRMGSNGVKTDVMLYQRSTILPQLKTLWLENVTVSHYDLKLLFSCPLLKTLVIVGCDVEARSKKMQDMDIESHSLSFLHIIDVHFHSYNNSTTMISGPNVKVFRCEGSMQEKFSLAVMSNISHAYLHMRLRDEESDETAETYHLVPAELTEEYADRMLGLLRSVMNVHHLVLSSGFLQVLTQTPAALYPGPPLELFYLETLKLDMRFTSGCLRSIAYLLSISPTIKTLEVTSKEPNLEDVEDDWEAEFSLLGLCSQLKFVEIKELEGGCYNEIKLLRFLLKNLVVLENLHVVFGSTSGGWRDSDRMKRRIRREIRKIPAASSKVRIHFS